MPEVSQVKLRFPARPEFLRLARLAATDAASRVGFDIDEIEDLRIAVSELCAMVGDRDSEMNLVFTLGDGHVEVQADAEGLSTPIEEEDEEDFMRALIDAVVDEFDVVDSETARTIRVVKRRRSHTGEETTG